MKIIAWNCNMAFRAKAKAILAHHPDILVVPECEHPDKLHFPPRTRRATDVLWFGTNPNKGLGVFSYNNYHLRLLECHNPDLKMIVPIRVTGGASDFNLFAVWANHPGDPDGQYVEQVWKALRQYDTLLSDTSIWAGDFNSNTIWDRKRREGNHSTVVRTLEERNIHSVYHLHHKQVQGKEKHPTHFLYRHKDKPYHLDYCFASAVLAEKLVTVQVGTHRGWSKYSDHVPVIATFRDE